MIFVREASASCSGFSHIDRGKAESALIIKTDSLKVKTILDDKWKMNRYDRLKQKT